MSSRLADTAVREQKGEHLSTGGVYDVKNKAIYDRVICPALAVVLANEKFPGLAYDKTTDTMMASWNQILDVFLKLGSPPEARRQPLERGVCRSRS